MGARVMVLSLLLSLGRPSASFIAHRCGNVVGTPTAARQRQVMRMLSSEARRLEYDVVVIGG